MLIDYIDELAYIFNSIDFWLFFALSTVGYYLTNIKGHRGYFFLLLLVPFAHKEYFSLVKWDVLPIRAAMLGVLIAFAIKLYKESKSKGYIFFLTDGLNVLRSDLILLCLLLLWYVRFLSIFFTSDLQYSLGLMTFFTFIIGIYVYVKYLLFKNNARLLLKMTIKYMIILGFVNALFTFVQLFLRTSIIRSYFGGIKFGAIWTDVGLIPRTGALFWDVNHYGAYLITIIPLALGYMFYNTHLANQSRWLLVASTLVSSLILSQSRSAILGLFIGLMYLFISYICLRFIRAVKTIVLLIFVTFMLVWGTLFYFGLNIPQVVSDYMHLRLDSTDNHFVLLEGSVDVLANNLIAGAGYGNFDVKFRETDVSSTYFGTEPTLYKQRVPAHSVWGEILAEIGGIGLVLYSTVMLYILASVCIAILRAKTVELKYIGVSINAAIIGLLVAGLFYSYNLEFYWLSIFLGVIYAHYILKKDFSVSYVIKFLYSFRLTPYIFILPISIFYIFWGLGNNTLLDFDEAIYAKVAKNIVESSNWLSLKWDDFQTYWHEKPPMYMWFTALFYKLFGVNEVTSRLLSALMGLLSMFYVYKFGSYLYNRTTGIISSLILLSTVQYLYYSRLTMLDISVSFSVLVSIYFFYLTLDSSLRKSFNIKYALLTGALVGYGVMVKSIIGLIPIPIMFLYYLYFLHSYKVVFNIKMIAYMALSLIVVVLPWHLYAYLYHGQKFINEYFIEHVFSRGTMGLGHREAWYFYLIVIKISSRVWVLPIIAGIASLLFIDRKHIEKYILLIFTSLFIFVFFTLSRDKLQWYIIPIYPFLSIIAARFIVRGYDFLIYKFKDFTQISARTHKYYIAALIFILFWFSALYVVLERDKIYRDDPNKYRVEMVKLNNMVNHNSLSVEDNHNLYFSGGAKPVFLFYSDYPVKEVNNDEIIELASNGEFNKSDTFVIPETTFNKVLEERANLKSYYEFSVKGVSGKWVLVQTVPKLQQLKNLMTKIRYEQAYYNDYLDSGRTLSESDRLIFDHNAREIETIEAIIKKNGLEL